MFVVAIALLLLAMRDGAATAEPRDPGPLGRLAIGVFLAVRHVRRRGLERPPTG